jgi:CO/xanthine dehydrogenase Mo-binding subunit
MNDTTIGIDLSKVAPREGGFGVIGIDTPQVNAREKVMGRAMYAGDMKLPGMLHMKVLRSPYAHARIVSIDTEAAKALPGVRLVLTGEDTPTRLSGVLHKEHRILAAGKVRFIGEEVVAVAAVDENTAKDALELINVEYEVLPALFSTDQALADGAIEVHEETKNISHTFNVLEGDVDAAFERAAFIYEATYDVHSQYPGYLEPMATVASMGGDGRLTVWTSTQSVFLQRMRFAEALDMPESKIRVIAATVGGGFGGKTVEECNSLIAAFMASRLDRPVRFLNSRLEDFQGARASVPEKIWLKMGVDKDGIVIAKDVTITAECGAYTGLAPEVLQVSTIRSDNLHRGLKDMRSRSRLVYTNNPPRGAFRGFGGQQMSFAVNSHLSVIAEKLGIDPLELHKRNAVHAGDKTVHGFELGSCGLVECLEQVRQEIGWDEKCKRDKGTGTIRRGIGLGAAIHVSGNRSLGNWDGATVSLKIGLDGRAIVSSGEGEMGQGLLTMLTQVCAEELGLPMSHITVLSADTDTSAYALGSFASRATIIAGNAAILAAKKAKGKLLALAAEKFGVSESDLEVADGKIFVRSLVPGDGLTFGQLARLHIYRNGGEGLQVTETYDPPTVMANKNQYGNVAPAYSFAAQAVDVEVDTETGRVTIVDTFISDDCGKALNPMAVHGQTYGAAVQAIGWTLYEHLHYSEGQLMNGNFADYTMPTADSVPEIRSGFVESNDPNGPYGAKGASETAMVPGGGAIANAVYDAIGVRINSLPITPEIVLAGLKALKDLQLSQGNGNA